MGTATPPPPVIGANCAHCDGILWPAGKTPLFIKVTFADLIKCPGAITEPPNAEFILKQLPGFPCSFELIETIRWGGVIIGPGGTIKCWSKQNGDWWFDFWADWKNCDVDYENTFLGCGWHESSHHGTCHIDFIW